MAEEIAREQKRDPGLCAVELGIAIPQHGWPHLAHQQPGEQRARQQDGEEVHQADEEFLGVQVHFFLCLAHTTDRVEPPSQLCVYCLSLEVALPAPKMFGCGKLVIISTPGLTASK